MLPSLKIIFNFALNCTITTECVGNVGITRNLLFSFQMERDDALTELEIMKEKLDKALYSTQKTIEEKETAHKEYEKMLEKYDRYI